MKFRIITFLLCLATVFGVKAQELRKSVQQMQQVLTNIYDQGAKSVEHGAIEFESLREEIGKINGIGEKRLDEIMAIIESFIVPAE